MKVTMFSNYLTHHQIPFCKAMVELCEEFYFVSTTAMEAERKQQGWDFGEQYTFEVKSFESKESMEKAERLAIESDVIIIGSAPENFVRIRMKEASRKITFRYSERIYKGGRWRVLSPRGAILRCKTYFKYINKPIYMLCSSGYTAGDLAMLGSYIGRCYKWGYFPETRKYDDFESMLNSKKIGSILWVARLIDWKHPETAINVAERLKNDGYSFTMKLIGQGNMEKRIRRMIGEKHLEDNVKLYGSMKPEDVRTYMEHSEVFLFTSDQKEGWGAVLNEAMNSGCALVANNAIGSVPFLLKDGENGFVYKNSSDLYRKIRLLLENDELSKRMGREAYKTIIEEWNAENAARKFIELCNGMLCGNNDFADFGICSKAPLM